MSALRTRPSTAVAATALAAILATVTLTGCGGDDDAKASPTPTVSAAKVPTSPVATQPGDLSTRTTASALPVPSTGPRGISTFPVPPGVQVKAPAPQQRSWQFDITTKDPESVLAFYRKALRADGYTVRNDVDSTVGVEQVRYDIQFTGPARGYIVSDPESGTVFVAVESLPRGNR